MPHSWKIAQEGTNAYFIFTPFSQSFFQIWINSGDVILIGLRAYQDKKADVILKYNADEARNLKTYGELPENGKNFIILVDLFEILKMDLF